jgi:2-polyprenyl-6-methoxyphenol hydroxylase-like FAD-dependent oxidoreductase
VSATPVPDSTTVCIAGCGPAGGVLGLMLARAGIEVVVLEKYPDFFRDFRGDTIHASTLRVLADLDLLPVFEKLPQQRTTSIAMMTDEGMVTLADFTDLPGRFQYLSMVPQWDFLSFITGEAKQYPTFTLCTETEAVGLIERDGVVRGVRYRSAGDTSEHELQALLTVAADGRHSTIRKAAGLTPVEFGAPMDLLWYRIPKGPDDPEGSFARVVPGRLFPMIDRRTYWQGAYTMPKGSFAMLKAGGIETLREDIRRAMPFLGDRVDEALRSWDDTGFLEVQVNRLERWHRPRAPVHRGRRARDVSRRRRGHQPRHPGHRGHRQPAGTASPRRHPDGSRPRAGPAASLAAHPADPAGPARHATPDRPHDRRPRRARDGPTPDAATGASPPPATAPLAVHGHRRPRRARRSRVPPRDEARSASRDSSDGHSSKGLTIPYMRGWGRSASGEGPPRAAPGQPYAGRPLQVGDRRRGVVLRWPATEVPPRQRS